MSSDWCWRDSMKLHAVSDKHINMHDKEIQEIIGEREWHEISNSLNFVETKSLPISNGLHSCNLCRKYKL